MFYQPVVSYVRTENAGTVAVVVCSIECSRRNGAEPVRLALPDEYDTPCGFCSFDPQDFLPVQELGREEIDLDTWTAEVYDEC